MLRWSDLQRRYQCPVKSSRPLWTTSREGTYYLSFQLRTIARHCAIGKTLVPVSPGACMLVEFIWIASVVITHSPALFSGSRNFIINGGQYVIGNVSNSPAPEDSSTMIQAMVRLFEHDTSEFDTDHPCRRGSCGASSSSKPAFYFNPWVTLQ